MYLGVKFRQRSNWLATNGIIYRNPSSLPLPLWRQAVNFLFDGPKVARDSAQTREHYLSARVLTATGEALVVGAEPFLLSGRTLTRDSR